MLSSKTGLFAQTHMPVCSVNVKSLPGGLGVLFQRAVHYSNILTTTLIKKLRRESISAILILPCFSPAGIYIISAGAHRPNHGGLVIGDNMDVNYLEVPGRGSHSALSDFSACFLIIMTYG